MDKSYYCNEISRTLHFLPDKVKFCCSYVEGPGISIDKFSENIEEKIILKRQEIENDLAKGIIPKECLGCKEIKKKNFEQQIKDKFFYKHKKNQPSTTYIIVDHFKQCDCNCIYCAQKYLYPGTTQNYELLPIIKFLYSKNLINTESLEVEFQGGGIAALKEFKDLLSEFSDRGCKNFIILANNINYIPFPDFTSPDAMISVSTSLDAGSRETFYKIKGYDAFDTVLDNIQKLSQNPNIFLSLKYIIIKDVNDNIEELSKFLQIAAKLHISLIRLEIDFRDMLWNKDFLVPKHYYKLFAYAERFCKINNIYNDKLPFTYNYLRKNIERAK